jgi:hypothetical protein
VVHRQHALAARTHVYQLALPPPLQPVYSREVNSLSNVPANAESGMVRLGECDDECARGVQSPGDFDSSSDEGGGVDHGGEAVQ